MRLSKLLAGGLLKHGKDAGTNSRPVVLFAIAGIALGIAAMLISVMVVKGFQDGITKKVSGFMAHIRINAFSSNVSFEEKPLIVDTSLINRVRNVEHVKHVQTYAHKACILKAKDDIQGVVLKGAGRDFDWTFFEKQLIEGSVPHFSDTVSNEVLLSAKHASELKLKTGDTFLVFFIQDDRKIRKLKVAGVYNTGLGEEFDRIYLICDLNLIRRINSWDENEAGGYEVILDNFKNLDKAQNKIYSLTGFQYNTQSIRELYPQIFNWLDLQNLNVIIIITLISLVAGVTMISTLLILVLENARHIGILKAMGANNRQISSVFLNMALYILIRGLIIGNIIAFTIAFIQLNTGLFKLDESSYYLSTVPVSLSWITVLWVNLLSSAICLGMMLIPSRLIGKIETVKVLRFE